MAQQELTSTTQNYLDIHDITNDMVIMKDGTVSVILTVDALNFGLLAEQEQDAIIYSYAGLLNSLNFPIQIVIKSQTKDVTGYLHLLEEQEEQAPSRHRQEQIKRYRGFVGNLIQERNVLDKKFYIIIPASAIELGILTAQSVVPGVKTTPVADIERSVILEKARNNLEPKRDHVISQFGRIGLYARQLTTQEIIQLYYVSYNPEAIEGQQLTESSNYTTPVVQARVQGVTMPDQPTNQAMPQPGNTAPTAAAGTNPPAGDTAATPNPNPQPGPTATPTQDANPATQGAPANPAAANPQNPAAPTPAAAQPTAPGSASPMGTTPPASATPSADDVVAAATSDNQPEMPPATKSDSAAGGGTEADAQAEINSTLENLGQSGAGTGTAGGPSAAPVAPTAPGTASPAGQTPASGTGAPAASGTSVPPTQPTTAGNADSNDQNLPEI